MRITDTAGLQEEPAEEGVSSHSLSQADLVLVRAQLRAIALQPAAGAREAEAEGGVSSSQALGATAHEISQEIETALPHQLGGGGVSSSHRGAEQGVCAAAVETCLWFGLALGEPPRSLAQRQQLEQQVSVQLSILHLTPSSYT